MMLAEGKTDFEAISREQLNRLNTRWQTKDELFELAEWLYLRGFTVLPLRPRQKVPTHKWQHLRDRQERPTWTELKALFEEAVATYGLDINIGALTGRVHNFVVIDVDDEEAWRRFKETERLHDTAFAVWIVKTGRGFHIYFAPPEDDVALGYHMQPKNRNIRGVALLGEGHIVVLPPSVHEKTGNLYQWLENFNPVQIHKLNSLPLSFLQAFEATDTEVVNEEEKEVSDEPLPPWLHSIADELLPHWREGVRHNLTLALTGLMRKRHIPMSLVMTFVKRIVEVANDEEEEDRLRVVLDTYKKPPTEVAGYQLLSSIVGVENADKIVAMIPSTPEKRRSSIRLVYDLNERKSAMIVLAYFGDKIIYTKEHGFFYFNGVKFVNDDTGVEIWNWIHEALEMEMKRVETSNMPADEKEKILNWLRQSRRTRYVENCLRELKSLVTVDFWKLDSETHLINLQNGVLNLETFELYPHLPDFLMTKVANAAYEPDADCPMFKRFLEEITLGDRGLMDLLQRIAGYTLLGDVGEEVVFFLYGTGANGKTTFLKVLKGVLGDYAKVVSSDILLPQSRRRSVHPEVFADLYRLRMAVIEEWLEKSPLASDALKISSTTNEISARHLYKKRFTFTPTHKLFISTNHLPKLEDMTEGAYRRILILPFRYFVPADKRVKDLAEKILEKERNGVLNWMLDGLRRYYEVGLKVTSEIVRDFMTAYRSEVDLINEWLEKRCVADEKAMTKVSELYADFVEFLKAEGTDEREIMSRMRFSMALAAKGYPTFHTKHGNVKRGIRLLNSPTSGDTPRLIDTEAVLADMFGDGKETEAETPNLTVGEEDDDIFPF